ncbi:MAG: hypothetical protein DI529_16880 [Chryseobacterium sp.]|nr:MAG: hypothetical protein DI529_16880 [Chryseobacterium sp.]
MFAQPGDNYNPNQIWIVASSKLQFQKNNENILTPEKILDHYNLYIQYIEDSLNLENENELKLDRFNVNNYKRISQWTKLSKREKKKIPYYLKVVIPSEILPISVKDLENKIIPNGAYLNLSLEDKVTLERMNIIIRTCETNEIGKEKKYFKLNNTKFHKGYFLYDFCLKEFNKSVSISLINSLIKERDIDEP